MNPADASLFNASIGAVFNLLIVGGLLLGAFSGWWLHSIIRDWLDAPFPGRSIEQMQDQIQYKYRAIRPTAAGSDTPQTSKEIA